MPGSPTLMFSTRKKSGLRNPHRWRPSTGHLKAGSPRKHSRYDSLSKLDIIRRSIEQRLSINRQLASNKKQKSEFSEDNSNSMCLKLPKKSVFASSGSGNPFLRDIVQKSAMKIELAGSVRNTFKHEASAPRFNSSTGNSDTGGFFKPNKPKPLVERQIPFTSGNSLQSAFKNAASSSHLELPNKPLVPLVKEKETAAKPNDAPKKVPLLSNRRPSKRRSLARPSASTSVRPQRRSESVPQIYPLSIIKLWEKNSGKLWNNLTATEKKAANLQMAELVKKRFKK